MPDRERLGRYRIVRELGRGGMGVVYQAEDALLERTVALKTLIASAAARSGLHERLFREARLSARLDHPHVIRLHDIGSEDGVDFLVLEFVEGRTLRDILGSVVRMRTGDAMRLFRDVADGVAYAHTLGIVHRDLKPENIMVTTQGQAKVMDFGLAWQANQARLTHTGGVLGTLAYFSPEQAKGQPADGRSDLYSLGAILFELLTGELVFAAESAAEMITHHLHTPPRPASSLVPTVPVDLDRLVIRCLQKDPGDRYPSVQAMLDVLEPLLLEPFARPRATPAPVAVSPVGPSLTLPTVSTVPPVAVAPPEALPHTGSWGPFQRMMAKMQESQVVGESVSRTPAVARATSMDAVTPRPPTPDSFDSVYRHGKTALEGGRLDDAGKHLRDAARLNPRDARPYRHLAALYARQKRIPDAIEACRTGLKLAPDHARLHAELGDLLARSGERAAAAIEYEAAVKLRPDLADTWRPLARLHLEADRVTDAVRAYEALAGFNTRDPEVLKALPGLYLRQSKADRAETAARRAMKYLPGDAAVLVDLARALDAQRQTVPAAQVLQDAIKLDPDTLTAWECLVALHRREQRPTAAQAILEQALARHPHASRLLWLQGDMDVAEGRTQQAAERYERALGSTPAIVSALQLLGSMADVATLQRKMAEDPDNVTSRAQLGRLYVRTGQGPAASDVLQQALQIAPHDLLLHFLLGQARRLRGQTDAAIRSFQRSWQRCNARRT